MPDESSNPFDIANLPDSLRCEQCGVAPVDVVMVSLSRGDSDRLCSICAMAMFIAIAQQSTADAPA